MMDRYVALKGAGYIYRAFEGIDRSSSFRPRPRSPVRARRFFARRKLLEEVAPGPG